jgi:RNA polymerase sigma-70 factor, ECF subfamily
MTTNPGDPRAPTATSLTLLQQIKARDQQAWWRLVYLYAPLVEHWCRRWHMSNADIEDVSQDVFQGVAGHIEDFRRERPGDSFRGWLWTITRNKIGDHFRRRQGQPNAVGGPGAYEQLLAIPEQLPEDTDAALESGLLERAIHLIRSEFEERTLQMFWKTAIEGQEPRDVAAEMGITPNGVRLARSRVQRLLRERLGDLLDC